MKKFNLEDFKNGQRARLYADKSFFKYFATTDIGWIIFQWEDGSRSYGCKTVDYLEKHANMVESKPVTKTVHEWMYKNYKGTWLISQVLRTESEVEELFDREEYATKTGRSWEVESWN